MTGPLSGWRPARWRGAGRQPGSDPRPPPGRSGRSPGTLAAAQARSVNSRTASNSPRACRSGSRRGSAGSAAAPRTPARPATPAPAGGDQHLQPGRGGEELLQQRRRLHHLLEVVDHQQELLVAQALHRLRDRAPGRFEDHQARATTGGTRVGSVTEERSAKKAPSLNAGRSSAATRRARRDLPVPPGPVRVSSRVCSSSALASAISCSRPTNG